MGQAKDPPGHHPVPGPSTPWRRVVGSGKTPARGTSASVTVVLPQSDRCRCPLRRLNAVFHREHGRRPVPPERGRHGDEAQHGARYGRHRKRVAGVRGCGLRGVVVWVDVVSCGVRVRGRGRVRAARRERRVSCVTLCGESAGDS